ncbi:MAG: hypothetical protein Q9163_002163 [Psora crenata]
MDMSLEDRMSSRLCLLRRLVLTAFRIGAFAISLGLPIICYLAAFLCNDVTGCPVPSTLHLSSVTLEKLKRETGWPGITGLASIKATLWVLGYYALSLLLHAILPGTEVLGTELTIGGKLKYKFNAFSSALVVVGAAAVGTFLQGADFPLWTFIWNNYIQIITANLGIAFFLACYVYIRSFSVKKGNKEQRELAPGGHTGNLIYDWFIGRELNPRITLPLVGTIDIKSFCELRPGMLGWVLLDLAFVAHQYKLYGSTSDSILLITFFQAVYVFDALYNEPAILTTIDITTDGFGFMLAFGDLVWLPFIYSLQARYLAVHQVNLGLWSSLGVSVLQGLGYWIFRSANNEKHRFRTNPRDAQIAHLEYIQTESGSKLLTSGWWGRARHINYLGDIIMAWSYCLPTGIAGYVIRQGTPLSRDSTHLIDHPTFAGSQIVQGEAKGWGMVITYFYVLYFTILLIHREMRDEEKCMKKYGKDWEVYKKKVPYRILPYIY